MVRPELLDQSCVVAQRLLDGQQPFLAAVVVLVVAVMMSSLLLL